MKQGMPNENKRQQKRNEQSQESSVTAMNCKPLPKKQAEQKKAIMHCRLPQKITSTGKTSKKHILYSGFKHFILLR